MSSFQQIEQRAIARKGAEFVAKLQGSPEGGTPDARGDTNGTPPALSAEQLAAIPDDRWLSMATNCIFCSGFNWKVVQHKWAGFEEAFEGFDLGRWIFSNDDDLGRLVSDTRIIRNGMKIKTVPENARFFGEIAKEHGSFGTWIGNWPVTDQIGLMDQLNRRGSRLGAMTGQYFLRFMGKDSFILSRDVTAALVHAGVVDKQPGSKKALAATQAAFNDWMSESGLGLTAISRTLAHSIDG